MLKAIIRFLLPVMLLAGCAILSLLIIKSRKTPEKQEPPPSTIVVEAVELQKRDYQIIINSQGIVRARTESSLIPEVAGRIKWISPNLLQGGFFEKDELLVELDSRDYEFAVEIAKSGVARARLTLAEENVKAQNYHTAVIAAKSRLAEARLVHAEEDAKAQQALHDWQRLSGDEDPGELVLRKPQLSAAKAAVAAMEADLEQRNHDLGLIKPLLQSAEAAVAAAQAELRQRELDLARTRITAPYSGRVLNRNADVGQYITPGTEIARVYSVDYAEIRLPLSNRHLEFVDLPIRYRQHKTAPSVNQPGVKVIATIGARQWQWNGYIERVDGAIDLSSRQLFVIARVDDPYAQIADGHPPLRVGQFVEAFIDGRPLHDVFVIPRSAIHGGNEVVIIKPDQTLTRRPVVPVWKERDHVVVNDNLEENEWLCLTPVIFAGDNVVVKVNLTTKLLDSSQTQSVDDHRQSVSD